MSIVDDENSTKMLKEKLLENFRAKQFNFVNK